MNPAKKLYQTELMFTFPFIRFAFAYGSAVFPQQGRTKGKMLDMVFAVDDTEFWHAENLKKNPSHYSAIKYFGTGMVEYIQNCACRVYYNPMAKINDQMVKYGVISIKDLAEDLRTWRWLYISGRLQKPVIILSEQNLGILDDLLKKNLKSAALTGLLFINSDHCTEEELYRSITKISYTGDFRMYFGEDRNKISKIVQPNVEKFRHLYEPYLRDLVHLSEGVIIKKKDNESLLHDNYDMIPTHVREKMEKGKKLQEAIGSIVFENSIKQSLKGIITSGLLKSVIYSSNKIGKMLSSLYHN